MSLVGKKFPNIAVDAMSDMGDTFRLNVLEQAISQRIGASYKSEEKGTSFLVSKRFHFRVSNRITRFSVCTW